MGEALSLDDHAMISIASPDHGPIPGSMTEQLPK
jgi:hypothetical protein